MSALLDLYKTLPRQGPGDCAEIDGLLAWAPEGQVTAVDPHAPFIAQIKEACANDPRVTVVAGCVTAQSGPFELVWGAGALNFLGLYDAARQANYGPLQARIHALTETANAEMAAVLQRAQAEIDGWRAVPNETGYLQIVAHRR